jgi:hypothetical protein
MTLEKRVAWIATKNMAYAVIIYYLWKVGFFTLLFVWLPFMATYYFGQMLEYGAVVVLKFYAIYWITLAIMLTIFTVLVVEYIWKLKRRDFKIGGEFEGKIVWAKGVRQGLIYDVWDVKNYINWKLGKKKGVAATPRTSGPDTDTLNGTAPSPWDIPLGPKTKDHYVIYVRRTLLPSIPHRFFIPKTTQVTPTPYTISIPNAFIERVRHPTRPGRWDYQVGLAPKTDTVDTSKLTRKNRNLLHRAAELVEIAVESDSETKKKDFEQGSFDIPSLKRDEGAYDR